VTVVEAHAAPGGKMRTVPAPPGRSMPGPTVLTMRGVFDDLFAAAGTRLDDHLTLIPQPCWRATGGPTAPRWTCTPTPRPMRRGDPRLWAAGPKADFRRFDARTPRGF
jgi:1-hydroxycarotenoid 3,4-desaturase